MCASKLDVQRARSAFRGLDSGHVFADNARESQVLTSVADIAQSYRIHSNSISNLSKCVIPSISHGYEAAAAIFNASSAEEVVFGVSSTQLLGNLARAVAPLLQAGDGIIVTGEHQANVDPWRDVAASHNPPLAVCTWKPATVSSTNPYALSYNAALPSLCALLTARTRIVALPGCSNILGELLVLKDAVRTIRSHSPNALIVVDLAAFAPHRIIDVRAWDVDFAVFSFHKLYGPRAAALYARCTALEGSIGNRSFSLKATLGGVKGEEPSQEELSASSFVLSYLTRLSTPDASLTRESQRMALECTSKLFEAHETGLTETLLTFLTSHRARARGVRVVGPEDAGPSRAPTVSFFVLHGDKGESALHSRDVVKRVGALDTIRIRFMQFNPHTVMTTISDSSTSRDHAQDDDGVVRISLVHYNTVEEVERIVRALSEVLF